MIQFTEEIPDIAVEKTSDYSRRDPESFLASQIGFCPRQLYLSKLGLRDTTDFRGKFKTSGLVRDFLQEALTDRHSHLQSDVGFVADVGDVQFIGHPTFYDAAENVVYALKARNGWYSFHPPVDRHVAQLQVYLHGLNAERGRIIYVSKGDLGDVRTWPPESDDEPYIDYNAGRIDILQQKAEDIRSHILRNGIATRPEEIPYATCDCYFCDTESLVFDELQPSTSEPADGTSSSTPATPSMEASGSMAASESGNNQSLTTDGGVQAISEWHGSEVLDVSERNVPEDLREHDIWVVWDCRQKVALAPWQTGTMFPAEWAADKDVNPRRPYTKAQIVAEMPVSQVHGAWPFPDGEELPKCVKPAVLLPHDPPDPPIIFVDFDDVRDPDTGEVSAEVIEWLDRFDSYTEISGSGTGVHVYARGQLPESFGAFQSPLETGGSVEIYDHSRFTGGTWSRVNRYPRDDVSAAKDTIQSLLATYDERSAQLQ